MGLLGFSHVGVCCSDLDRSTRFYCDVLGFRDLFTVGAVADWLSSVLPMDPTIG